MSKSFLRFCFIICALFINTACATLYPVEEKLETFSLPQATHGNLWLTYNNFAEKHGDHESGFLLVKENLEALKWRLAVIDNAVSSLDMQYFLWHHDLSGILVARHVIMAADRGVRVRWLIDDLTMLGLNDRKISILNQHPNIEIRVFNPGHHRSRFIRVLEFIGRFSDLNRRMHNKIMIADGRVVILGGRNIGDEYFGMNKKFNFIDLDLVVTGRVTEEISHAYDDYWNNDYAHPGEAFAGIVSQDDLDRLRKKYRSGLKKRTVRLQRLGLLTDDTKARLSTLAEIEIVGEAHFFQDDAVKMGDEEFRLVDIPKFMMDHVDTDVWISTPYLIPGNTFLDRLEQVHKRGADIHIITGSLGSNNHTAAHSHYRKYRQTIIDSGVNLYEFRPDPGKALRKLSNANDEMSGSVSLHIKAFVTDDSTCFIGSLNIDPRAIVINTENGLYVRSPKLAEQLNQYLRELTVSENSWQVKNNKDGKLIWVSADTTKTMQPAKHVGQRISDFFWGLLPIESQL